jgi:hypothetical protein
MFATAAAANGYNFTANSLNQPLIVAFRRRAYVLRQGAAPPDVVVPPRAAVVLGALPPVHAVPVHAGFAPQLDVQPAEHVPVPVHAGFVRQLDALPAEHVPVPVHAGFVPQLDALPAEHVPAPVHAGYVAQVDPLPLVHAAVVAEPANAQRPLAAALDSALDLLRHAAPLDPRQPGHEPRLRRS